MGLLTGNRNSPHQRAHVAGRNALLNLAAFLYPTALTIVVTPIVLHYVGTVGYGIFALATVIVGFLAVLDLGIGTATIRYVAEAIAEARVDRARELVRVGMLVYALVGLLGLTLTVAAALTVVPHWFDIPPSWRASAQFVFAVAGVGFLPTMVQNAFAAVPPAMQRYDIAALVGISLTTADALATVAVLAAGLGIRGMVVVAALEPVAALLAYGYFARRLLGRFRLTPLWRPSLVRDVATFSGFAFLGSIAGLILFQLDKVLIGAVGTTRQVSYYVIPGNIAQRIHTAAANLNAVVLPSSTELTTAADDARTVRLYARASRFTALLVLTITVAPIVFAGGILRYWVGTSLAQHSTLAFQVLIATYGLLALSVPAYFVALGRNRPRVAAVFNVAMAVINVPLVLLLVPRFGSSGAAFAFLASMAPVLVFVAYVERAVLRVERSPWVTTVTWLVLPGLAACLSAVLLREFVTNLPELVAALAFSCLLVPTTYVAIFAPAEDRILLRGLLRTR